MHFLVEKAVGKDTLALRVNYVIFHGFLRVFYGDFTGFLRLRVHLRVFYAPKTWFLNMSSKVEQTATKCIVASLQGLRNQIEETALILHKICM